MNAIGMETLDEWCLANDTLYFIAIYNVIGASINLHNLKNSAMIIGVAI